MTVGEVFAFVESFTNLERGLGTSMRPYRLDRMRIMLELFGNPHRAFRVVHVAGSKGKGSTAAYIASILQAAGARVGLYTSPHVSSYKERITEAGEEIDDEHFIGAFEELLAVIPDRSVPGLPGKSSPTTFELLTLLAFLIYRRLRFGWAVVETGIGGRLDATNLVVPECSVITPIELEHTEILGHTLGEIASEKAGIIKPGIPAYASFQRPEAEEVLAARAASVGSSFTRLADRLRSLAIVERAPRTRVRYSWSSGEESTHLLGMNGAVQAENGALAAIVAGDLLRRDGMAPGLIADAVTKGLASAFLPGRMEIIPGAPEIVLDAAHTPSSITRLLESFRALYPSPRHLLFGSVQGKNHEEMARILAPHFERIVVSKPGSFKQSDPQAVYQAFARFHDSVRLDTDPAAALTLALDSPEAPSALLVTGSFYMVAEIRTLILQRREPCTLAG